MEAEMLREALQLDVLASRVTVRYWPVFVIAMLYVPLVATSRRLPKQAWVRRALLQCVPSCLVHVWALITAITTRLEFDQMGCVFPRPVGCTSTQLCVLAMEATIALSVPVAVHALAGGLRARLGIELRGHAAALASVGAVHADLAFFCFASTPLRP